MTQQVQKKKSRKSTADAVEYLTEGKGAAKEIALKEQELELRKKEQENMMERKRRKEPISRKFDRHHASTTTTAATDDVGHNKSTTVTVAVINFYGKFCSKIIFPGSQWMNS